MSQLTPSNDKHCNEALDPDFDPDFDTQEGLEAGFREGWRQAMNDEVVSPAEAWEMLKDESDTTADS